MQAMLAGALLRNDKQGRPVQGTKAGGTGLSGRNGAEKCIPAGIKGESNVRVGKPNEFIPLF